ncbi:hypothetical protein ACA910_009565 [Epithemia clementina (nom. ined.)]
MFPSPRNYYACTTAVLYTSALSLYYLWRIQSCHEHTSAVERWSSSASQTCLYWIGSIPLAVGLALAAAGIPHYGGSDGNGDNVDDTKTGMFWVCYIPSSTANHDDNDEDDDDTVSTYRYAIIFTWVPIGVALCITTLTTLWMVALVVRPWNKVVQKSSNKQSLSTTQLTNNKATTTTTTMTGDIWASPETKKANYRNEQSTTFLVEDDAPSDNLLVPTTPLPPHSQAQPPSFLQAPPSPHSFLRPQPLPPLPNMRSHHFNGGDGVGDGGNVDAATTEEPPADGLVRTGRALRRGSSVAACDPSIALQFRQQQLERHAQEEEQKRQRRLLQRQQREQRLERDQEAGTAFVATRAPRRGSSVAASGDFVYASPHHLRQHEYNQTQSPTKTKTRYQNQISIDSEASTIRAAGAVNVSVTPRITGTTSCPNDNDPTVQGSNQAGLASTTTTTLTTTPTTTELVDRHELNRRMALQCVGYWAALLVSWPFLCLAQITSRQMDEDGNGAYYPILVTVAVLTPLQGFWNALVYWYWDPYGIATATTSTTTTTNSAIESSPHRRPSGSPSSSSVQDRAGGAVPQFRSQHTEPAPGGAGGGLQLQRTVSTRVLFGAALPASVSSSTSSSPGSATESGEEEDDDHDYAANPHVTQAAPGVFQIRQEHEGRHILDLPYEEEHVDISSVTESLVDDPYALSLSTLGFEDEGGDENGGDAADLDENENDEDDADEAEPNAANHNSSDLNNNNSNHNKNAKAERRASLTLSFIERMQNGLSRSGLGGSQHKHDSSNSNRHNNNKQARKNSGPTSYHESSGASTPRSFFHNSNRSGSSNNHVNHHDSSAAELSSAQEAMANSHNNIINNSSSGLHHSSRSNQKNHSSSGSGGGWNVFPWKQKLQHIIGTEFMTHNTTTNEPLPPISPSNTSRRSMSISTAQPPRTGDFPRLSLSDDAMSPNRNNKKNNNKSQNGSQSAPVSPSILEQKASELFLATTKGGMVMPPGVAPSTPPPGSNSKSSYQVSTAAAWHDFQHRLAEV